MKNNNKSTESAIAAPDVSIWFPAYVGDYFTETRHLSNEEKGIYCDFLHLYWNNQSALKNDDKHLANLARVSPRKWKPIREKIEPLFFIADGYWHSKRLNKELPKAKLNRMQKQLAAHVRHGNTSEADQLRATMTAIKHAAACPNAGASESDSDMRLQCSSPPPSPPPSPVLPEEEGADAETDGGDHVH